VDPKNKSNFYIYILKIFSFKKLLFTELAKTSYEGHTFFEWHVTLKTISQL